MSYPVCLSVVLQNELLDEVSALGLEVMALVARGGGWIPKNVNLVCKVSMYLCNL